MKIGKRVKKGCALALAAFLGLSGLSYMRAQAADPINLEAVCSITISVSGRPAEGDSEMVSIPVRLYKVAAVKDVSGRFEGIDSWQGMEFNAGKAGDESSASQWRELAGEAERKLEGLTDEEADDKAVESGTLVMGRGEENAKIQISDLGVGMYLIVPEDTYNENYSVRYTFTPYLTALPSSEYTLSGAGSDVWDYETEVGLKVEAEQQYGDLVINKTLNRYNSSLGEMTCVFRVTGTYGNNRIYDNVISASLSSNSGSVTLNRIPAGMEVTVTEEYAGASYEIVGDSTKTAAIVSSAAPGYAAAEVSFTNDYDGGNRGGTGVTNRFDSNIDQETGPDDNNNVSWPWIKPETEVPET